jgi:gliding motility-associated-like protein
LHADGHMIGTSLLSGANNWSGASPFIDGDNFGISCAALGDLDQDGMEDIAVSARYDDNHGSIWIICLNTNYSVKSYQKIGKSGAGGLQHSYSYFLSFGFSIESIGDLNSDGVVDLVAGLRLYDTPSTDNGGAMILYLNSDGTVQHEEVISNSEGLVSGSLGISGAITFGSSVCRLGDLDGDHVVDLAVGAASLTTSGQGNVWLLNLNPKPIVIVPSLIAETPSGIGDVIDWNVKGGVRPYGYIGVDTIPTTGVFSSWLSAVDTVGFGALGMPTINKALFTYSNYKFLDAPSVPGPAGSLRPGKHRFFVEDQQNVVASKTFRVGCTVRPDSSQGISFTDVDGILPSYDRDVQKTASAGWTNMKFKMHNWLPGGADGWLQFTLPALGTKAAVGFRERSAAHSLGYPRMTHAFYFSGDSIYAWYSGALHYAGSKYNANDVFVIERTGTSIKFLKNEATIATQGGVNAGLEFIGDLAIYNNGGKVNRLTTSLPSTFLATPIVQHRPPLFPKSGSIAFDIEPSGTYSYDWVNGGTDPIRSELEPAMDVFYLTNRYQVNVSSGPYNDDRYFAIDVGNKLLWEDDTVHSVSDLGLGSKLIRTGGSTGWGPSLRSINSTFNGNAPLSFTPVLTNPSTDAVIVGLRSNETNEVGSAWWVHGLGTGFVAEAISQDSIVRRHYFRAGDLLSIDYSGARFLVNGGPITSQGSSISNDESYHVFVALRSTGSTVEDLHTTASVPLILNTDQVEPGIPFTVTGPGGSVYPPVGGVSGQTVAVDLGGGPFYNLPGFNDYVIDVPATSSTDAGQIAFVLDSGKVMNVRMINGTDTFPVDSSLHEMVTPNQFILYNEAGSQVDNTPPPFYLDLQDEVLMTPNGDLSHDLFKVQGLKTGGTYQLTIKDRSANVIYQTTDRNATWNGKYMNTGSYMDDGVYVYVIDLNGTPFEGQFLLKK